MRLGHRRRSTLCATLVLCASLGHTSGAQRSPKAWRFPLPAQPPELWIPEADPELHLQRQADLKRRLDTIYAIGPEGFGEIDVLNESECGLVGEGKARVCLLLLRFPSHLRHFLSFRLRLGRGDQLVVYTPSWSSNRTTCLHNCVVVSAKDVPSSHFRIPRMDGDSIMMEYWEALECEEEEEEEGEECLADDDDDESEPDGPPFIILEAAMQGVGEGGLREAAERRRQRRRLQWQAGTQFDMLSTQVTGTPIGGCTQQVVCNATWNQTQARGVVAIYVVDPVEMTVALCSGAIINSPGNNDIYLLTADHCFHNKSNVNLFQNWVLAFNYKTATCGVGAIAPPMLEVVQGVGIRAYDTRIDILVLQVAGTLADTFRVFALGYDGRTDHVPKSVVGLHHPSGDTMHISYAWGPNAVSNNFTAYAFPPDQTQPTDATHFEVRWSKGATAAGSSGSPLLDAETGLVVGVLTGGPSSCSNIGKLDGRDYYGRLGVAFELGLSRFLSNVPSRNITASDAVLLKYFAQGSLVVNQQQGRDLPTHGPAFNYFPTKLGLSLDVRSAAITYYLTDSPQPGETITAHLTLKGDIPGNLVDAASYVEYNASSINFTAPGFHKFPHTLDVQLRESVTSIPGGILRFIFIVELYSNTNASYRSINVIAGTMQTEILAWWQFPLEGLECSALPCTYNRTDAKALNYTGSERAVFARRTSHLSSKELRRASRLRMWVDPDAYITSMLTAYCDGVIVWCETPGEGIPRDSWESIYVWEVYEPSINGTCTLVLSDFRDLDAALPLSLVTSLSLEEIGPAMDLPLGPVVASPDEVVPRLENLVIPLGWRSLPQYNSSDGVVPGMPSNSSNVNSSGIKTAQGG